MTFIPRVLPTAYLPNIAGSVAKRNELVDKLSCDFCNWLLKKHDKGIAESKKRILPDEILNYFKNNYPNVKIQLTPLEFNPLYSGVIQYKYTGNKSSIEGYHIKSRSLGLKDNNSVEKFNNGICWELVHEHHHLADYMVNPKKMARESAYEEAFHNSLTDFFRRKFYHAGTGKNISDKKQIVNLKKDIKKIFKRFSSNEKILVLQRWRYSLSSEWDAFNIQKDIWICNNIKNEFSSKCFEYLEKTKKTKMSKKVSENLYNALYCKEEGRYYPFEFEKALYPQKIQMLNEMLAEEIKDHRTKHTADLRARKIQTLKELLVTLNQKRATALETIKGSIQNPKPQLTFVG